MSDAVYRCQTGSAINLFFFLSVLSGSIYTVDVPQNHVGTPSVRSICPQHTIQKPFILSFFLCAIISLSLSLSLFGHLLHRFTP